MDDITESDYSPPPAPDDLAGIGLELWERVTSTVELRADEQLTLAEAARTAMMLERIRKELDNAPLIVRGVHGQPVPNGLLNEARQYRLTLLRLLTSLGLPDPDDEISYPSAASIRASRAAQARWRNHVKRKDLRRG